MRAVKGSAVALLFIKRAFGIHSVARARARHNATENFIRASARGDAGEDSAKKRKKRSSLERVTDAEY